MSGAGSCSDIRMIDIRQIFGISDLYTHFSFGLCMYIMYRANATCSFNLFIKPYIYTPNAKYQIHEVGLFEDFFLTVPFLFLQ